MARYFLEVAYKGTRYSGFQVQENAVTIQSEVTNALSTIERCPVLLTGSSRTDAGVHALQNFFHFDSDGPLNPQLVYKMNALLPPDIVVRNLYPVRDTAHSRFDALHREYEYRIYRYKNPFLRETGFFYPYKLDLGKLREASRLVSGQTNFFAFAKTNTQVRNFTCTIYKSEWREEGEELVHEIVANRFLRGMVRLLTATMLKVGRGTLSMEGLEGSFVENPPKCSFSIPSTGLFLKRVVYPENFFGD
ncbi:MAG: pseudouridine synthase [Flaviaesturariibacter sp.]|nr:pseudouridine synthase [Flaviaesturariibacter sp.]